MFGVHINGFARACHVLSMYSYRFELFYSTPAVSSTITTNFLANFLVDSLGFSRENAVSTSAKVTRLNPTINKPDSFVNFLEKIGLNKPQIKTLVSSYPRLLFSDIDKTLKPKIEVLRELGLSESDLAKFIAKDAYFFCRSIDTTLRPNLDYLRKLLHENDDLVVKVIKKEPRLLSKNLRAVMPPNVALMQNLGFSSRDIEKVILQSPRLLLSRMEWLADVAYRVENILHIPRESPMFIHGVVAFASLPESILKMKLDIFRSFGWPESDIYAMVRRLPYVLTSSEAKLRNGLEFFMKELGYESSYLASLPTLLKFSFEKRIVPRNDILKVLKEKQLIKSNLSLYGVVTCSEVQFLEKYVLPFRDELPEVYDIYIKSR